MALSILVADDSATVRTLLRIYLSARPVEVVEAEDGVRAASLVRVMRPDLVIADVRMPGLDGLALLRGLRGDSDPALRLMPVILLTSDRSPQVRSEAQLMGANSVIYKPVSREDLLAEVDRLLPRD